MKEKNEIYVSRNFKCDAKTLFGAIGEGAIILETGAIPEKTSIDFKVGGKYSASWESCESTSGEFLEIIPHSKIVFTWNKEPENKNTFNSTVTLNFTEHNGVTTLNLKHEGLPTVHECKSHVGGWEHTLDGIYKKLSGYFAKTEKNESGLDLNFHLSETVKAPLDQVFNSVKDHAHLQKYFDVKMSDSFKKGESFTWDFEGHPTFTLETHELVENKLIKFQWGDAHVVFYFNEITQGETQVKIHATGYRHDPKGVNSAFKECSGWTGFLSSLKGYCEKGTVVN